MLKKLAGGLLAGVAVGVMSISAATAGELTVYTAVEAEDLKKYAELQRGSPGHRDQVDPRFHRHRHRQAAGGEGQPAGRRDLGAGGDQLLLLKAEGMLEAYAPKGLEKLDPKFRDKAPRPPGWAWTPGWRRSASTPSRRKTRPADADVLEGPDQARLQGPRRSCRTRTPRAPASWTCPAGCRCSARTAAGPSWTRCTRTSPLHPLRLQALQAWRRAGEIPIGVSFAFRGAKSKAAGAPLEIIVPAEGVGWDMEATAIVNGTKKLEAAKTLAGLVRSPRRPTRCTTRATR